MQLKNGSELQNGKYHIIRVLGQGGFGITYLAENTYFDKKVAIKEFFPKDFCGRDNTSHLTLGTQNNTETVAKLKTRFLKEAKNISKLDHPGIVRILDIFEENNTAYYVMDYIDGENLNEIVKRNGPLPEAKAVEYIRKVGDALEYIHSRNMTHFDVKPANIVVRKTDEYPILLDFGLSKQYTSQGDATSTLLQGVSHGFSPIELYSPGNITSFSPQTDIYSLGATLYYLITGKVPPNATEIALDGIKIPQYISVNLSKTIENSMETKRLKRYSTINSFLASLYLSPLLISQVDVEKNNIYNDNANSYPNDSTIYIKPKKKLKQEPINKFMTAEEAGNKNEQKIDTSTTKTLNKLDKNIFLSPTNPIVILIIVILLGIIIPLIIINIHQHKYTSTNHSLPSNGYINYHEWVDLDLASGVKWAVCNVGAEAPHGTGDHFAWGETESKTEFTNKSIMFERNRKDLNTEGIVNSEGILTPLYDVANIKWGASWRIPTKEEWEELSNKCTWNQITFRGKKGYQVIGPNGNSIFYQSLVMMG